MSTSQAKGKRRTPSKVNEGKSRSLESCLPAWTNVHEFKTRLSPTFIEYYGAAEDPWDMANYLVIAAETVKKCQRDKKDYEPVKGDPLAQEVRPLLFRCKLSNTYFQ
jgi:hypothetical protein